ncbi:MAG: hypothetical protein RMJ98_14710 [Myxococcales bacterium]|nr:hypothetical protein [Polyangiaceae bacterium]MDW8250544.1 hypothetical protein [Myxococcales bacterium]
MLRALQNNHKGCLAQADLPGSVLAGVVEVAFLLASSSHILSDPELDDLARLLAHLLNLEPREGEFVVLLEACSELLEIEGYDARINALLGALVEPAHRRFALQIGAEVLLADEGFRLEYEGEFFLALGLSLGFSQEELLTILREAQQRASLPG